MANKKTQKNSLHDKSIFEYAVIAILVISVIAAIELWAMAISFHPSTTTFYYFNFYRNVLFLWGLILIVSGIILTILDVVIKLIDNWIHKCHGRIVLVVGLICIVTAIALPVLFTVTTA